MISERLLTIASLVPNDAIVADIGSDHALLPIYLVKEGLIRKAYAIDNKKGPLEGALENIQEYNMEDKVIPILSSGLTDLKDDVNTVVIAGMGYATISKMIQDDLAIAKKQKRMIIQCNNHLHKLRKLLFDLNFEVLEEKFLKLNDIEYLILAVSYTEDQILDSDHYVSEYLIKQHNQDYLNYLEARLKHLEPLKDFNDDFKNEYNSILKFLKTS